MSSAPTLTSHHSPANGASRRGRPPGPPRRPGAALTTGLQLTWQPEGWERLSGRAQILLAAAFHLDQQIQGRITLERMCQLLELDAHNLTAAFKQFHGCTMSAYLQQFRVRCLFQAIAVEPEANLFSLYRRFGLGPTPSERRCFRNQFGLSIEAHQQRCREHQAADDPRFAAQPGLSAMEEALSRLALGRATGLEHQIAGYGMTTTGPSNTATSAAGPF